MDEAVSLFSKRSLNGFVIKENHMRERDKVLVRIIFVTVTKSEATLPPQ